MAWLMDLKVKIVDDVLQEFPDLMVLVGEVKDVESPRLTPGLKSLKRKFLLR